MMTRKANSTVLVDALRQSMVPSRYLNQVANPKTFTHADGVGRHETGLNK